MESKLDPVDSVLSASEPREMILKKLDLRSLLNCRLVSKSWSKTASSVLRKRPIWIRREWNSHTLHRLYNCVYMSTDFPFSRLDLSIIAVPAPPIDYGYAIELLARFGDVFTHLRAEERSVKWNVEMVTKLLKAATELEYLQPGTLPPYIDDQNPQFRFQSLRILSFQNIYNGDKHVLTEIIRAAPKLEEIQDVSCVATAEMGALRKTQKLALVSSLTLSTGTEARAYSELAMNPPQLKALTVDNNTHSPGHYRTALKSILKQSENSLKKLKFVNCYAQLNDLLVLHNLEELDLNFRTPEENRNRGTAAVLPRLSNSFFPKLKTVRLDGCGEDITEGFIRKHFWEAYDTPLESVVKLELASYCEPAAIEYLAKLFPRVTYVSVGYVPSMHRKWNAPLSNIWLLKAFHHLSKLQILGYAFNYGSMDTFLTGIPTGIVANLRGAPKNVLTPWMSEILRPHGNILELKNLRELTVTIVPSSEPTGKDTFMTMVSIWYALEMIPGLRTNFLCCSKGVPRTPRHYQDFQKAFQPVKDQVMIGPCLCETH